MSEKEQVQTPHAPAAVGPYSQAVRQGKWLFISGQIPLNPKTGRLVSQDIREQTAQVLENIEAVLESAGGNLAQIVQTTVFLTDLADFSLFNEVYSKFFRPLYPARATAQVAALPLGAKIEISAIAVLGD